MANLGLKLKVFFFIVVVITALSAANFLLFRDFIVKIDVQSGAKNAAELVESKIQNISYNLISNSFGISKQQKIEKGKVVSKIDSVTEYAIINQSGAVIDGSMKVMNSLAGIPAVDRALKSGVASDGMLSVEKDLYLVGVAPFVADGNKIYAAVSFHKFSDSLLSVFPMPVRVFRGDELIAEKGGEVWHSVENSYGKENLDSEVASLVKSSGNKEINKWTRISCFFMPYDVAGGEKVTFVAMTSLMPSWETYEKVLLWLIVYSVAAIIIAIFFAFIVTHEIDKILKNLASDVSRMRVGEKLVLKKYSNGADIVVSAMNKLISMYLELNEDVGGITSSPLVKAGKEKGGDDFGASIPDPFASEPIAENKAENIEKSTPKPFKPAAAEPAVSQNKVSEPAPKQEIKPELSAVSDDDDDDDDNEKTQIAPTFSASSPVQANPFDALWDEYCRIKRKNGEPVNEREKSGFIGKVRTNKATIMAKYKCSDVQFSIEEKDGKPVVKAKPVN